MTIHISVIANEGIKVLGAHFLFSFSVDSIAYKVSQQSVNLVSTYKLVLLVKNYANPLSIFWLFNFFWHSSQICAFYSTDVPLVFQAWAQFPPGWLSDGSHEAFPPSGMLPM